ncbi:MAG TPA: hypothetical protein VGM59_08410 [Dongiaceae bacterium]|jgi:hypothetical protein
MINSAPTSTEPEDKAVDAIVRAGPRGALVLAGIATAVVVAIWFAFYLFVFTPRGPH